MAAIKKGLTPGLEPLIFLYGRSGSGKSATVMGRPGAHFRGLAYEWFAQDANVGVQVMEYKLCGYRDLVMGGKHHQRPIESLAVGELKDVPHILSKAARSRTLMNSQSSRSFVSITLFDQSNDNSRVTIIDMPGTRNRTALDVDGYSKDDIDRLQIDSQFIMKTLNSFTDIISIQNNTSGGNHLFTPLVNRIDSTEFNNIFLIACAAGPLNDENSKEIFHFLAKIKGLPDDYELGSSRTPIAPASMARNTLATPAQRSFQRSPIDQLRAVNEKLKAELDAVQKNYAEANERIAELTRQNTEVTQQNDELTQRMAELSLQNVNLSQQVAELIETRNGLQQIIIEVNNDRAEVKRTLDELRQHNIAVERDLQERIANERNLQLQIDELNRRFNVRRSSISVVARRISSSSAHSHSDSHERNSDVPDRNNGASDEQNPDQENDPNEQTDADDDNNSEHDGGSHSSTAAENLSGSDGDEEDDDDNGDAPAGNVYDAGNDDRRATDGSDNSNDNDGGDAAGGDGYLDNHDWEAEFSDPTKTAMGIEGLMVPAFRVNNKYYQVFDKAEFSALQWERIIVATDTGRRRCTICNIDIWTSRIKNHVFEKHSSGRLYCNKCRLSFSGVVNVVDHQKKCKGVIYECHRCNEKFSSKPSAAKHRKECTPELPADPRLKSRPRKRY
ncbi:kinesin-related protein 7 [Microplitis demolitor]|uniref:kinesin-related protein 7 n=1 Tax=Microplitis demolitor TaxID=69319 RepID=UPI00235B6A26|nr:kinesin-related protein 7 [Microplitis demolitor]